MAFLRRRDTMPPTPPLPITEDTPPDMLAGSMDLRVVLPTGHSVKMSVERSTPMMDLLVQVTTLNKISTGGHVLQAIGERGILPYKPSTPIGALDTWTIQVVPKSKVQTTAVQKKAPLKPLNQQQPFEPTFRLQVHLPRNQLYVTRVSSRTLLSDILHQTCTEKNLDPNKYELRHPANLSQLLSPSCTLADYGLQEVTLVARSRAPGMGSALSSSDIMALQREEDKRRQQARQQHGTGTGLGLVLNKQSQSSVCEGSVSSDSLGGRSISPARSDESASRSASPPAPSLPPMMAPLAPARPARKRRPAPKPPSSNNGPISNTQRTESNVQAETSSGTVMNGHSRSNNTKTTQVPVSHSRNSSDSSGYHEASVLSESPAEGNQMTENCAVDTLPREGKLVSGQPIQMKTHGGSHGLSRSMSSLNRVGNMAGCQHSTSNSSLASSTGQGLKKKKAPPPPPGAGGTKDHQQQKHLSSLSLSSTDQDNSEPHKKTTSLERHLSGKNSAAGSVQSPDKYSTLPGKMKMSEHDYRPVESPVKKPKIIPETKIQSPEEGCLDGDQKIPEVEEDVYVLDISKETPLFHSQMHQGEHDIATTNQSSDRHIVEKQDKCFEQLPMPPVETTPETPVELASKSNSPQVVNTGTPEEPEEYSGMEPGDEVEEAFKSVTAELETAIKQDRDASALPPPPTSAASPDDLTVDWEYQLPAPPSAFRDSDSPTLTEGETVMLADTQVFRESPSSPEPQPDTHLAGSTTLKLQEALDLHLNSVVHRNEVTKTNPLFDPLQCEDDIGDNRMPDAVCEVGMEKLKNYSKNVSHMETKSQKQNLTEEELMKPKSLRDKSQVTSTMKGVPRSGENVNFTITTYQRPFSTDKLLNEDSDSNRTHSDNLSTDSLKEQTKTVSHHHKYSSTSSLNSSAASLSRTNSFNGNDNGTFTPPDPVSTSPVKRSTSYISLVTNPLSHPGNGFQSGSTNTLHTGKTKFVGNMAAQTQMDKGNERVYESWSLRKTTSECNVSQVPPEHHQEGTKSQTTVEEQKIAQVGQDKEQGSQKQIIITEEERAQLLALQEQFLQLQEQLLQNSGLMQQQQLSQPQVPTADTPLQSLQVLRSILPQLNKTKVLSDYQATSQQQKSDNSAFLRSETLPTELDPKDSEDFPNNESVKQTTDVSSNQQNIDEETSSNNNSGERKRYTYTGPPAINFATWSERPKSQVSIKMDCDYRIGIGQGGRTDERNKTPARTGMSESKDKISAVRSNNTDTLHEPKNDHEEVFAQNKMNGKLNSSQQVTEIEPASLTMRLISHTTASGFQKPVAAARKKTGSSSYIAGEAQQSYTPEAKDITQSSTAGLRVGGALQQNDPSRVPIVRAVELKKSFIQQQNMYINPYSFHSSSTMLNGDEGSGHHVVSMVNQRNSTAHHNGGSDADSAEETFAGVNFLAKRFSSAGSSPNGPPSFRSSRPLSSYGKVETVNTKGCDNATSSPYNTTLSYKSVSSTNLNASNVNTYQDAQLKNGDRKGIRRYTSVIGISNDIDHNLTLSSSQEPASESSRAQSRTSGPSVVRVNGFTAPKQLMPVVKGFQFASANANRDISAPLPAKNSNTTNASHTKVQRSESTSAIRSWKTVDTTDHSSSTNSSNTKTYLRRNSNESRPEQMVVKVTTKSAESEPPPPPPLAGSLQKSMARPRPRTLQAPQLSTRDQLMDAIRNFGGRGNLKQVCDNRDSSLNVVLIR
ncbi:uncharacterized protein LOC111870662 isoform X4 [Cryptotermes secundus]|nr:uncharacterized protein LOC111870662 isoform X4 [Cryptotermes secundus]